MYAAANVKFTCTTPPKTSYDFGLGSGGTATFVAGGNRGTYDNSIYGCSADGPATVLRDLTSTHGIPFQSDKFITPDARYIFICNAADKRIKRFTYSNGIYTGDRDGLIYTEWRFLRAVTNDRLIFNNRDHMNVELFTWPSAGFTRQTTLTPPGGRTWTSYLHVSVDSGTGNILVLDVYSTTQVMDLFSAAGRIIILLFQCLLQST